MFSLCKTNSKAHLLLINWLCSATCRKEGSGLFNK